jgi:hypothetical protein
LGTLKKKLKLELQIKEKQTLFHHVILLLCHLIFPFFTIFRSICAHAAQSDQLKAVGPQTRRRIPARAIEFQRIYHQLFFCVRLRAPPIGIHRD